MKILIIFFLIISVINSSSKDVVVTKDGNIYRGKIQKYDEKELLIELNKNNTFRISVENILTVDYDNNLIEDTKLIEKYSHAVGVGLFFPTDYSIEYNWILNDLIAEISIGSDFRRLYGFEIGFKRPFYFNKNIYLAPNVIVGYQYYDFDDYYYNYYTLTTSGTYICFGVNFNLYGFNMKLGFIPLSTDGFRYSKFIEDPLYLKIGYLYHF